MSSFLRRLFPTDSAAKDVLATMLLVAEEDAEFRRKLLFLLRAPRLQRESMVNTALHEMELRGESKDARAAFAVLADDEGAKLALAILDQE